jgi:biopolymer transport protein ExbD
MAGGGAADGEPEFQVAPMVDVLLTILVFFMMITSAQVLKVDKTITLPIAPDALKRDSQRSEVVINVRWLAEVKKAQFVIDDHIYANAEDILTPLKVAKALGEKKVAKSANPTFRAVIRGDQNVPALYVSQAMNACGDAGISDISFATLNK